MSVLTAEPVSDALQTVAEKLEAGTRLNAEDGLALFQTPDVGWVAGWADRDRRRRHGRQVFFATNININPTNVCHVGCHFCAFAKPSDDDEGAYTYTVDEMEQRVRHAVEQHGVHEVHIVGGLKAELGFDFYHELIQRFRAISDQLFIKAFTAVEIDDLAAKAGLPIRETLATLQSAGLNSMPGGGAEIFAERVRQMICPQKMGPERWVEIHQTAHVLGIYTNCTMLYGHLETDEERVDHLLQLRELQDATNGFQAFVPIAFHPKNTQMEHVTFSDGITDFRVHAAARLLLDNIPHIKAYWPTLGLKVASVLLHAGVDDLAGTTIDERIMHDAGAESPKSLTRDDLITVIRRSGCEPCEVDSSYRPTNAATA